MKQTLAFRRAVRHPCDHKSRAPGESDARAIVDVVRTLNAVMSDGMGTAELAPIVGREPGWLVNAARAGWFPAVATRGEPVTRYGKPVRPWLWYAEDRLPRTLEPTPGIDALARLKALARVCRADYATSLDCTNAVRMAVLQAIEGIEP